MTVPRINCLHVSSLQAKAVMITGTSVKRRLTWGNERVVKYALVDIYAYMLSESH